MRLLSNLELAAAVEDLRVRLTKLETEPLSVRVERLELEHATTRAVHGERLTKLEESLGDLAGRIKRLEDRHSITPSEDVWQRLSVLTAKLERMKQCGSETHAREIAHLTERVIKLEQQPANPPNAAALPESWNVTRRISELEQEIRTAVMRFEAEVCKVDRITLVRTGEHREAPEVEITVDR